jgi:hypothetical protein
MLRPLLLDLHYERNKSETVSSFFVTLSVSSIKQGHLPPEDMVLGTF